MSDYIKYDSTGVSTEVTNKWHRTGFNCVVKLLRFQIWNANCTFLQFVFMRVRIKRVYTT